MKKTIHLASQVMTPCLLAASLWAVTPAQAQSVSDTSLAYRYGSHFTEPARPDDIRKNILTLAHLSDGPTGIHGFSLEGRFSSAEDPAKDSGVGAQEYLFNYRYLLTASRAFDKPMALGPVRDVGLLAGVDLTDKNTLFAPRKRAWMAGPVLRFDVPGVLDVGFLYYKEANHKGIPHTLQPDHEFDGTWLLNINWAIPFQMGQQPVVFQGLFNRLGQKGQDFDNQPTADETLLRTALMFDVSQRVGLRARQLMVGVGYEGWVNKYGTPAGVGTETRTMTLNLESHF